MAMVIPFRALRPRPDAARAVAALPYDVMNVDEARQMVRENPLSFLHVEKSEVDVPAYPGGGIDEVFAKACQNLKALIEGGVMVRDPKPCLYLYRLTMGSREQTGIVAGLRVRDYESGIVKKHELTRADKEIERIRHIDTAGAQTGAIFTTFRATGTIRGIVGELKQAKPEIDFVAEDGIGHTVWTVCDDGAIARLVAAFEEVPAIYIADGHHRTQAAAAVAQKRRAANPAARGDEPYEIFLSVLFPDDEVRIMDYNRAVKDLAGLSAAAFLEKVRAIFEVKEGFSQKSPGRLHEFGMYLAGRWYGLYLPAERIGTSDPVQSLDVSLLHERLLTPVLGIGDPRTDGRITFIGGIRGMAELERLVDSGRFAVAFSLFPTSLSELMDVAEAGQMMPPKSTWFEPKLRSGLFVHLID